MRARLILIALGTASVGCAHGGMLKADGVVRTVQVEHSTVRLMLMPEFSDAYVVHHGGGRFEVELPYHAVYLLRAEAIGCATKEVIFDANLPLALNGTDRLFPMEILMEKMAAGAPYRYAGPVGLVYFDEVVQDFVYTTDHRRIYHRTAVVAALHKKEGLPDDGSWTAGNTGLVPMGDPLAARLPHLLTGRASLGTDGDLHRTTSTARTVGEHPQRLHQPAVSLAQPEAMAARPSQEASGVATPVQEEETSAETVLDPGPVPIGCYAPEQPVSSATLCGSTECIRMARCTVTIDHLNTGSGCAELRKAEHAYGATFYFHEGRSITEQHYRQLLGRQGWP